MRSKAHIGKFKIRIATFLVSVLVFMLIYIFNFIFFNNNGTIKIENNINPIKKTYQLTNNEDNNINVNLQRYYASLDLLDNQDSEYTYAINEINKDYKNVESPVQLIETSQKVSENTPVTIENNIIPDGLKEVIEISSVPNQTAEIIINESSTIHENTNFVKDLGSADVVSPELLPPTLFDPLIQTQEEYNMFNPDTSSQLSVKDNSFFDDFYVAGSATPENLYPDGSYYLSLFISDTQVGEIKVEFSGGKYSISVGELKPFLSSRLGTNSFNRIFKDTKDLISIDELIYRGVDASIDINQFAVYLKFSLADIPLIVVPVSKVDKATVASKNNQYGINDAELIKPAFVSLVSSINLNSSYSYGSIYSSLNPLTTNLYMSNSLQIGKLEFNFSDSLSYTFGAIADPFTFNFGSWSGAYLFYDKNITLTFGQVGGNLLSSGTPIGFVLEKSYGTGLQTALNNQFSKSYKIIDDALLTIVLNGEVLLSQPVKAGEYKFIDFNFKDGGNKVLFEINYDNEALEDIKDEFNVAYDSELVAKGDYTWSLSGSINKTEIINSTNSLLALPYFDGVWYQYNLNEFEMMYLFNMGVTGNFTLETSLAMAPEIMELSFNGILATMQGTYYGSLATYAAVGLTPSLKIAVSHAFDTQIGVISSSLSLTAPVYTTPDYSLSSPLTIGLGFGYTFNIFNLPPINSSLSFIGSQYGVNTTSSLGMTYSPSNGISFVSSFSASKNYDSDAIFSLQLSLNYTLRNNLSTSTSFSNTGNSSVGVSLSASERDSIQLSIANIQYLNDELPSYTGSWSHSGELSNFSLSQSVAGDFQEFTTNFGLTSNLYFANGLFAISSKTSNNFLLIKPIGKLASTDISISQTNDSTPNILKSLFGVSVYTDLVANSKNNLVVYGHTGSIFSSGGTFSYELNTNSRSSFTKIIDIPTTYTVSGILKNVDGKALSQYSAPVYSREVDDAGKYYLQIKADLYLFTDSNGTWILNDVKPGYYVFDLKVGKKWFGLSFEIPENKDYVGKVIEIEDYQIENIDDTAFSFNDELLNTTADTKNNKIYDIFGTEIAQEYSKMLFLGIKDVIDENTFFEKSQQVFDQTGFEESISQNGSSGASDTFVDPFADTASSWVDTVKSSF
ncbi:MAG: hypothetical protein JJE21_08610 [Spirochaetaceae bacterium]|nr:hypothetical protein [Spirochaetaceae bacterium]